MKAPFAKKTVIIIVLALLIYGCCEDCNKRQELIERDLTVYKDSIDKLISLNPVLSTSIALAPTKDEDTLYLETSTVSRTAAEAMVNESPKTIKIHGKNINVKAIEIDTLALDGLCTLAKQLAPGVTCSNFITGFRIFYSVNKEFTLYFKPVKFCRDSHTYGQGGQHFGHYKMYESLTYYKYNGGPNFTEVLTLGETQSINDSIDVFKRTATTIMRSGSFGPFRDLPDLKGDVKSLIFCFQEVNSLRKANKPDKYVRFWNAIEKIPHLNAMEAKHILLLSIQDFVSSGQTINIPTYSGELANLSHLCPPSCGTTASNGTIYTFRLLY